MAGRAGGRSRKTPESFLEVWGRCYPLREAWVRAAFVGGEAELDLFAQTEGRRPAGLCIEGLLVPGAATLDDLVGRTVIEPPPELLAIGAHGGRPKETEEDGCGSVLADVALGGSVSADEALGDEALEGEALEGARDIEEPCSERSAYIPGEQFAVERLRLELGERHRSEREEEGGGRIDALLHLEAVSYGEDGEVTDFDVPLVCVLRARLEAV